MMLAAADSFKVESPATDSFEHIESELERCGYVVTRDFIGSADSARLAADCRVQHVSGLLSTAGVGRGEGRSEQLQIRGDSTLWFDPAALLPAQSVYWQRMDELRIALNRSLLLGLDELEAHYARYPVGACYARHRDRFHDDDARVLSSVLYLNPGWCEADGGALRLYLGADAQPAHLDVYPASGTLMLFLSGEFDHEVAAATRERLSIAGWFRRRA
jgi:SM-20-related protein